MANRTTPIPRFTSFNSSSSLSTLGSPNSPNFSNQFSFSSRRPPSSFSSRRPPSSLSLNSNRSTPISYHLNSNSLNTLNSQRSTPVAIRNNVTLRKNIVKPVGLKNRKPIGLSLLSVSSNQNLSTYPSINNRLLNKNVVSTMVINKNRRRNSGINRNIPNPTFYEEFKNDILNNNVIRIKEYSTRGKFGIPYSISVNGNIKYFVKKIEKKVGKVSNQDNIEVEINNIKFINENIDNLPFMIETLVLRNVQDNKMNNIHNVYLVMKYLDSYITLNDFLENINNINKIEFLTTILPYLKNIFDRMNAVGILHVDLNQHLNNIMINPTTYDIKIIDYGMCIIKKENQNYSYEYNIQKNSLLFLILNKMNILNESKNKTIFYITSGDFISNIKNEYKTLNKIITSYLS